MALAVGPGSLVGTGGGINLPGPVSVLLREGQVGTWLSDHECSGEGTLGRLATVRGREGDECELQQERLELDIRKNCGT